MEQQGKITLWDDNEILPGDEWYKDISDNLADSDILLYLVSASSLASKNCNKELGEALGSKIKAIPIILERCDWQNHQLSDIQALPDKGKPINEWTPESKAWQNVVEGIRKIVDKKQAHISNNVQKETLSKWVFQQGNFLMTISQIDRAIEAYLRAIELDPNDAVTYNNRGIAYDIKGDVDLAIADYTKAIKLNPDYAVAYNNRGVVYGIKSDVDLAIADCAKAIKLNPDYAVAYNNRGNAYRIKGDVDLAIADYIKAIKLNPDYVEAYNNRGVVYDIKGDVDLAIADYTKAIKLNPDYAVAYNNRGVVYGIKGDVDLAIADCAKAIKLDPNDAVAHYNRGNAYRIKGDVDLAIADYTKAIKLNPDYAVVHYNRSMCWLHLQNWQEAKSDLIVAKSKGMDIIAAFRGYYKDIEVFERRNGIQLPGDIAAMLTQR